MRQSKLFVLIQDFFMKHLPEERGLSPNTVRSYRDATKDFLQYICKSKKVSVLKVNPKEFTYEALKKYLSTIDKQRGLSITTRNQRLAALKTLFSYLGANDLENIAIYQRAIMLEVKRKPYRPIDYFTENEMKAVLSVASRSHKRHGLLITLLYNTGARVQEICDLKFRDIVWGPPPSIYLTGKGNKRRQVPIWPQTAEILQSEFLRRGVENNLQEFVILNQKNSPMTRFGACHIVRKIAKQASQACPSISNKKIGPHVIRHTTAMHLLEAGVELSIIRMWLGHVSLNTTHDYVELSVEAKRKALTKSKKLKPANELKEVLKNNKDVIAWLESL